MTINDYDLILSKSSILTKKHHPYYIVAPSYTRFSAGIKALHLLCHALNRIGERAYLIFDTIEQTVNVDLLTPRLTINHVKQHFNEGLTPIVIYPEVVAGNPLTAPFVVRYVLNFPGLLGGDSRYPDSEFILAYSRVLFNAVPKSRAILFIPASDPFIFNPYPEEKRRGTCFYAHKYQHVHGAALFDITKNSIEITRHEPTSQTPEQLAELFRNSELFYCYENSALAIEATLCGCPVVLLPNKYFTEPIGMEEFGWDGIAWGTDQSEIERAKKTVHLARSNYLKLYESFEGQLTEFIKLTQQEVSQIKYEKPILHPFLLYPLVNTIFLPNNFHFYYSIFN